ncbi:MAG: LCP family protein [Clostridia bacterium]
MQDSAARNRMPDNSRPPQRSTKAKPVKKRNWKRFFTIMFLFLLLAGGAAAGAVYWKVDDALKTASSSKTEDGIETVDPNLSQEYHSDEPISMIILGRDTRKETGSMNTDVMVVAVVNPVTKKVTMLSIPRDTRIKIPGYRDYHKINSVYANGEAEKRQEERDGKTPTVNGITLTKKTLSDVFGIPIQYYVEVDFDGFKAVVDEVGGVNVNVDRKLVYDDPTDDTHINLEPGPQLLNGEQALGYVRHRHDNRGTKYFSNDFDRNRRQQEVIRAVMDKMTSLDGISKIFNVIEIGGQHVRTDLPPDKIKGIVYDFKDLNSSSLVTLENEAFWSGSSGYTFFPKEKMDDIRTSLRTEMGITTEKTDDYNNSVVYGGSGKEEVATSPKSTKKKKKPVEPVKPAEQNQAPAPESTEQPQTPPPDIPAEQPTETPAGSTPGATDPSGAPQQSGTAPVQPVTPPATNGQTTPPPDFAPQPAETTPPASGTEPPVVES